MSDKVVGLDGKSVETAPEYDTDVIALLERALADAKKYKAHSIGLVLIMDPSNGDTSKSGFDADVYWHGRRLTLLAGAARLAHRINVKCDEAMEVIT